MRHSGFWNFQEQVGNLTSRHLKEEGRVVVEQAHSVAVAGNALIDKI